MPYRLRRDDGAEHSLNGNVWEEALELAYLHGWRPAGTHAPDAGPRIRRRYESMPRAWDSQDYFSPDLQQVGSEDALALGTALFRSLGRAPVTTLPHAFGDTAGSMSAQRRRSFSKLAEFVSRGRFAIDGTI